MTSLDPRSSRITFSPRTSPGLRSFPLDLYDYGEPAVRVDAPGPRFYKTPGGALYPSITTVLGSGWKPELATWKRAVGEEQAKYYSDWGLKRGNHLHLMMEDYVLGRELPERLDTRRELDYFRAGVKALEGLDVVNGSETMLYSDELMLAGTCDLPAIWKGRKAIVDFKTSSYPKAIEEIDDYFTQTAGYSFMIHERTGHLHDLLVIVMANVDDETPTIHVRERTDDMIDKLVDARDLFLAGVEQQ